MSSNNIKTSSEEINLISILNSLIREKNLIFLIVLTLTSLSSIYFSKVKPIFAGSFEIVINEKNKKGQSSSANELVGLLTNQTNSLDTTTQKLILTSPSVLKPIHDYVNNYKKELTGKVTNKKFNSWTRDNLIVDFEENSTILKVTYMDTNKDLILNVLNLISEKYKDYSKSSTIKALEDRINYLSEQKIILSSKFNISKKAYDKFTIDNRLGNIDGYISDENITSGSLTNKNLGDFDNNSEQKSNSKAGQRFKNQFTLLEQYESRFVNLSSKLKPNSKTLIILKAKIDNLKESLKRPNEILIKYDELYRNYIRDENLLNLVEDNLAYTKLEQVKNINTWEIISSPIVRNVPIYPKRSQIFVLFLIGSSILGSFLAIIKEKLSKVVFEFEDIEKRLDCNFIDNLSKKEKELSFKLILNAFNDYSKKGGGFFEIINYKNKVGLDFIKEFIDLKEDIKVNDFNDFAFVKGCDQMVLIIEGGKYNIEEIETINKYLSFSKEKVIGWFLIKD